MFSALPQAYIPVFTVLAAIWAAAYVIGMLRGQPNEDRSRRLPRTAKLIMIAVTLIFGALWLAHASGTDAAQFALLVFLGLFFGAGGDLLLAGMFSFKRAELVALGVFGIGHAFYIAASLTLRTQMGFTAIPPVIAALAVAATLAALIWALQVRNPSGSRTMNIASLIYGILLMITVAIAALLWIDVPRMAILLAGITLFAVSDLLLAQYLIRRQGFAYIRDVVWLIYSTGQVLIAFAIGAAAALLR